MIKTSFEDEAVRDGQVVGHDSPDPVNPQLLEIMVWRVQS